MFTFIKNKITKVYNQFTSKIVTLFSRDSIDEAFLSDLKKLLISADTGIDTTQNIIKKLQESVSQGRITKPAEIREELATLLINHLPQNSTQEIPRIILFVGVNGSGKTTSSAKVASLLKNKGKKVLLVAADTFRAAAVEQLQSWGEKISVPVFTGTKKDPSSVIFDACSTFINENYDHIIVDTAGRLQTKKNLMNELQKIRNVIGKQLPNEKITTWLAIDSMLGQNSLSQARLFHEATNLDGLILTKIDGTGKGGIIFSITHELDLPLLFVTFGENINDIKKFKPIDYVEELLGS